jgi:hypothetical protein
MQAFIWVGSDEPMIRNNPVKHTRIFSFICIPHGIFQDLFGSFVLSPSDLWTSTVSNDHALYCMLNHGNTLEQLLHCLSLFSCQLESNFPPAAQLLLAQSEQGDLVGHHLRLSNVLENFSTQL